MRTHLLDTLKVRDKISSGKAIQDIKYLEEEKTYQAHATYVSRFEIGIRQVSMTAVDVPNKRGPSFLPSFLPSVLPSI